MRVAGSKRSKRIASLVQRSLANQLVREGKYTLVTISAVELSDDLNEAKVYVTCMDVDGGGSGALVESLNADSAKLRTKIAENLALRNTPRLHFIYDTALEHAAHLEQLMHGSRD